MIQPHFIDIFLGGETGVSGEFLDEPACTCPVTSCQLFDGEILIIIPVDELQDLFQLDVIAVPVPACLLPSLPRQQPDQFLPFQVREL